MQETEARVLKDSRWRLGSPVCETGRARALRKPRRLIEGDSGREGFAVIDSIENGWDATPAPQRTSSAAQGTRA